MQTRCGRAETTTHAAFHTLAACSSPFNTFSCQLPDLCHVKCYGRTSWIWLLCESMWMQTQTQKHSFDDFMYDTHTVHAHVMQGFESLDPGGRRFAIPTHKLVSQKQCHFNHTCTNPAGDSTPSSSSRRSRSSCSQLHQYLLVNSNLDPPTWKWPARWIIHSVALTRKDQDCIVLCFAHRFWMTLSNHAHLEQKVWNTSNKSNIPKYDQIPYLWLLFPVII